MLRFWLVCFGILFVVVELWEWLQQLTLPFPVCVMGGISLAIASNLNFKSIASHSPLLSLSQDASDSQEKKLPPFSQD
jgi:hypothetical protein